MMRFPFKFFIFPMLCLTASILLFIIMFNPFESKTTDCSHHHFEVNQTKFKETCPFGMRYVIFNYIVNGTEQYSNTTIGENEMLYVNNEIQPNYHLLRHYVDTIEVKNWNENYTYYTKAYKDVAVNYDFECMFDVYNFMVKVCDVEVE